MSERVERIRQLWGAANPDEHRAPQLIRDVQTLLAALAQAERERDEARDTLREATINWGKHFDEARAEVERLKAQLNANCLQRDALQIRTRALEEALGRIVNTYGVGLGTELLSEARAALTEPTPPAGGAAGGVGHRCKGCSAFADEPHREHCEIADLRRALASALDNVYEHQHGCLYCGDPDWDNDDNHAAICWYYSARAALKPTPPAGGQG